VIVRVLIEALIRFACIPIFESSNLQWQFGESIAIDVVTKSQLAMCIAPRTVQALVCAQHRMLIAT
jgi:hypothetical protein